MFIEDILGTESKIKILRTLAETNSSLSLEDLEKETKISRGILHKEVKRLETNKMIIGIKGRGKLKFYRLNLDNEYCSLIVRTFETEKIKERKNKILLATWNLLQLITKGISLEYKEKIRALILFGSTARGTSSLYSDIDLLAIISIDARRDKLQDIIDNVQSKIKNKINLNVMTVDEFKEAQDKKTTFVMEINKDGIDLYNHFLTNTIFIL